MTIDLAQHLVRTPAQGDEADPFPIQLRKLLVGGQLRVKNQFGGRLAGVLLPEPYELEDLVGLLAFGYPGVGIAQNPLLGIARQEDQNPLLGAAAAGNIVLFQGLLSGVGGHAMKVQVERGAMGQAGRPDLIQPGFHEAQADLVVDARGVGRQVGAFRDNVDACKQGDGAIRHQVHHVAFALGADQFQGQETADGLGGGNHLRTWQASRGDDRLQIDAIQQGHKQEQSG